MNDINTIISRLEKTLKITFAKWEKGVEEDCEVSVTFLKKFPNLEKLKVSFHSEQKIDFSGLDKLKVLICECCNFENIFALENLPTLKNLILAVVRFPVYPNSIILSI